MYICFLFMYVRMYVCMYVCTYVCMYVCMHVRMYVCKYVCMFVCLVLCMCSDSVSVLCVGVQVESLRLSTSVTRKGASSATFALQVAKPSARLAHLMT